MENNRRISKFFGKDLKLWKTRTQATLEAMQVSDVVSLDDVGLADQIDDDTSLKFAKARASIMQGLDAKQLRVGLPEKDNPFRMCARPQERYATSNISTQVQLQTRWNRLRYTRQPMSDFIESFEEIFNRPEGIGAIFREQMKVPMLLAAFGEKTQSLYGHIVAALQNSGQDLYWETVTARLLQEFYEKQWNNDVV